MKKIEDFSFPRQSSKISRFSQLDRKKLLSHAIYHQRGGTPLRGLQICLVFWSCRHNDVNFEWARIVETVRTISDFINFLYYSVKDVYNWVFLWILSWVLHIWKPGLQISSIWACTNSISIFGKTVSSPPANSSTVWVFCTSSSYKNNT